MIAKHRSDGRCFFVIWPIVQDCFSALKLDKLERSNFSVRFLFSKCRLLLENGYLRFPNLQLTIYD